MRCSCRTGIKLTFTRAVSRNDESFPMINKTPDDMLNTFGIKRPSIMSFDGVRPKRRRTIRKRKKSRQKRVAGRFSASNPRSAPTNLNNSTYVVVIRAKLHRRNEYESLRSHSLCELRKYRSKLCFAFVYFRFSARETAANVLAECRATNGTDDELKNELKVKTKIFTLLIDAVSSAPDDGVRTAERRTPRKSVRAL